MLTLLKHELQSRLKAILGWGIGLALFGAMYIAIYPEAGEQMAGLASLSIYKSMGIDLASFKGFMASTAVQYIPIILGIYVIIASTATLAGEEDRGTLELLLAMPIHRWKIVAMKALAIVIATFFMVVIADVCNMLMLSTIANLIEIDISKTDLFIATMSGWFVYVSFAMIGLFFGASLPTRKIAAIATTTVFIFSYFGKTLLGFAPSLEWLKPFSLFHYFNASSSVFTEGIQLGDVSVLLLVAIVFFGLAILSFARRDVTVGAWPWQRAISKRF